MAYCKNCGAEIDDKAFVCPKCGVLQSNNTPVQAEQFQQSSIKDNGGIGWGLLGCCIPIVGLVLFLVWKDTKPRTAKAAGIGALVAVIIGVVYYILIAILGIGAVGIGMM